MIETANFYYWRRSIYSYSMICGKLFSFEFLSKKRKKKKKLLKKSILFEDPFNVYIFINANSFNFRILYYVWILCWGLMMKWSSAQNLVQYLCVIQATRYHYLAASERSSTLASTHLSNRTVVLSEHFLCLFWWKSLCSWPE